MSSKDKTKDNNGTIPPKDNGNDNVPEKRDDYCDLLPDFAQSLRRALECYQESAKGRVIEVVDVFMGSRAGLICKTDEWGVPQINITDKEIDNRGNEKTQRFFIGADSNCYTMAKGSASANLARHSTTIRDFEASKQTSDLIQRSIQRSQRNGEQVQKTIDENDYEFFPIYMEKGQRVSINEDRGEKIDLQLILSLVTHARQTVCQRLGAKVKKVDVALMRWTEHMEYCSTNGAEVDSIIPRVAFTIIAETKDGSKAFGCIRGAMGTILQILRRYDLQKSKRDPMEIVTELAENVAKEAMDLDRAQSSVILGNECPVILSPGVSGVMGHEVFGHPSEGDIICENRRNKAAKVVLKTRIGSQVSDHTGFTIIDTGNPSIKLGRSEIRHGFGSIVVDDMGHKTKETTLVKKGIQVNVLSDPYTFNEVINGLKAEIADAMKKHGLSGNVRREKFDVPTQVRMTNTCIMPDPKGPKSLTEMASLIPANKTGIYVKTCSGGWVDTDNGTWGIRGNLCYLIQNSTITDKPVKDVIITGQITKFLSCIKAIGNEDTIGKTFSGYCGKDGQWVPVEGCGPIIYMDNASLGGGCYRPWAQLVDDYHTQHTQKILGQRPESSIYFPELAGNDDSSQSHANVCLVTACLPIEHEVDLIRGKADHADFEVNGEKLVDRKEVYDG